jgi:hypothetical protein
MTGNYCTFISLAMKISCSHRFQGFGNSQQGDASDGFLPNDFVAAS